MIEGSCILFSVIPINQVLPQTGILLSTFSMQMMNIDSPLPGLCSK